MKRTLIAAAAALGAMAVAPNAHALVQTGVLDGNFWVQLPGQGFDRRPHLVELQADLSTVSNAFLSGYEIYHVELVDYYPGQPPQYDSYGYDAYNDYFELTPTGFSFILSQNYSGHCNPYVTLQCQHTYVQFLELSGTTTAGPIEYTYKITAIPEPSSWALAIVGFGFAGALLRRGRNSGAFNPESGSAAA